MTIKRLYGLEWTGASPDGRERFEEAARRLPEGDGADDTAGDMLVFASEDRAARALKFMSSFPEPVEWVELLRLGFETAVRGPLFEDYVFESRNGSRLVDLSATALFSLRAEKPGAEPAPALSQLEEHLIASLGGEGGPLFLIDRHLAELAERIARAFGCEVRWEALGDRG